MMIYIILISSYVLYFCSKEIAVINRDSTCRREEVHATRYSYRFRYHYQTRVSRRTDTLDTTLGTLRSKTKI